MNCGRHSRRQAPYPAETRPLGSSYRAGWPTHLPRSRQSRPSRVTKIAGRRIIAALGQIKAVRLEADEVEAFLNRMVADGYATGTIKITRSVLVRSLKRGQRSKLLSQNVAELVPTPRGTLRKSRAMNTGQVRRLLAGLSPWWTVWVAIGAMLGLRPGELLGLGWDEVDFSAGVIRVRYCIKRRKDEQGHSVLVRESLKTERSRRTVEMPAAVRAALIALRKVQAANRLRLGAHYIDSGLVLSNASGAPCWPSMVAAEFDELCAAAGLGKWTPRELRHTFCSILSDAGTDIEKISDAMGHKDSSITRTVYRHALADKTSDAARVMDDIIWGDAGTGSG
jgi:integrase